MLQSETIHITGAGKALAGQRIANSDLPKELKTSDEWIKSRTGIAARYRVLPGQTTATLATKAATKAIKAAGLKPQQIDAIIVATTSPDYSFPSVASQVQKELDIQCPSFDIAAACSGFIHGLQVAEGLLKTQSYQHILLIGADTYTNLVDWQDRSTCVLFGDGAGAVVLSKTKGEQGLLVTQLGGDASAQDALISSGGVATSQTAGHVQMNGRQVYKLAVKEMSEIVPELLAKAGKQLSDITWLVPHQANQRILSAVCENLGFPEERMISTVAEHANTSAASIPLALATAQEQGQLKPGELLLLLAFGAGFAWGGALIYWR